MKDGLLRKYREDNRGTIAVIFGIGALVLIGIGGFALNISQLINARSALQNALDAAVTATSREVSDKNLNKNAARIYLTDFLMGNGDAIFFSQADILLDDFDLDKDKQIVSASASANVNYIFPMMFERLLTASRVKVESAATYNAVNLEVAFALDVSSSMSEDLDALEEGVKNAIAVLTDGQDPSNPNSRIALIPYGYGVNLGPLAAVTAVMGYRDTLDPSLPLPDNCVTERTGDFTLSNLDHRFRKISRPTTLGVNACSASEAIPLTSDTQKLYNALANLALTDETMMQVGLQIAMYFLSSNWKIVLPKESWAAPPKVPGVRKILVLMSDGLTNLSYVGESFIEKYGTDPTNTTFVIKKYCDAIKSSGIEIFSVKFGDFEHPGGLIDNSEDCASADGGSVQHFYLAKEKEDLIKAFEDIAFSIKKNVITK